MRKYWPESLISWARVLDGRFSDPRVGRDVLAGVLFQVGLSVYLRLRCLVFGNSIIGGKVDMYESFLMGPTSIAYGFLESLWPLSLYIYYFAVAILLLALTRSKYVAIGGYILMMMGIATGSAGGASETLTLFLYFLAQGVFLARFGFLAWLISGCMLGLLNGPITTDTQAFYYTTGLVTLLTVLAVAVWGSYVSVGGYRGLTANVRSRERRLPSAQV